MVLHSFCLDCFSTFTHCLLLHHSEHLVSRGFSGFSSSSLLCLKSAQLLPVFLRSVCVQNFRVVIIISGKVISTHELAAFFLCVEHFSRSSPPLSQSFIKIISLSAYFYTHLIWLQPSLTRARSFSVFFSASFTLIITIMCSGNSVNSLAVNDPHVVFNVPFTFVLIHFSRQSSRSS